MNPRLKLRPATVDDYRAAVGDSLPAEWMVADWVEGDVLECGGRIVGYGIVTQDRLGRFWGWADRGVASPVTLHRGALRLLAAMRRAKIETLHAICHPTLPGAERWLRRLGFTPTETITSAGRVWICDLST